MMAFPPTVILWLGPRAAVTSGVWGDPRVKPEDDGILLSGDDTR